MKRILAFSLLPALCFGCGNSFSPNSHDRFELNPFGRTFLAMESTLKIDKALDKPFLLGMDVSSLLSLEDSGVRFYNEAGEEEDLLSILSRYGVTSIRVRVWNDPYDASGHGYGGGNCDLDKAIKIGKRATKYKMGLILDFHYSDFWADPSKQMAPKAWRAMKISELEKAIYEYTRESLTKLKEAGVEVSLVQIGNEINGFRLAGVTEESKGLRLLVMASKAVRETLPSAMIGVHFTNPEIDGNYRYICEKLVSSKLDYDVFMTSYYPYWHGDLDNLRSVLSLVETLTKKKTMVAETSYANSSVDTDFFPNTISSADQKEAPYPFTLQGQVDSLIDVIKTVASLDSGIGVAYWEGAWISVGKNSKDENALLWESKGSGWASSYSGEYDPDDAGKWYGGTAVDNQCFFDEHGRVLESLKAFNLCRFGNK